MNLWRMAHLPLAALLLLLTACAPPAGTVAVNTATPTSEPLTPRPSPTIESQARPTDIPIQPTQVPPTEVPPTDDLQLTATLEVVEVPFGLERLAPGESRILTEEELQTLDGGVLRENFIAETGIAFRSPAGQLVSLVGPENFSLSADDLAVFDDCLEATTDGQWQPTNKLMVVGISYITGGEDASGDRSQPGGWILDAYHDETLLPNTQIAIATMTQEDMDQNFRTLTPSELAEYGLPEDAESFLTTWETTWYLISLVRWMNNSSVPWISWVNDFNNFIGSRQNGFPVVATYVP